VKRGVLEKEFQFCKAHVENACPKLPGPEAFTMMRRLRFPQKTPDDPGAIYTCLRTLVPVRNAERRPIPEHPT
jgi:hypothetical protein